MYYRQKKQLHLNFLQLHLNFLQLHLNFLQLHSKSRDTRGCQRGWAEAEIWASGISLDLEVDPTKIAATRGTAAHTVSSCSEARAALLEEVP
jgi:hypothetical protein